ncbi:MAG: HD-GYP domain-containing protein [Gaiellaceae bacterium]
MSQAQAERSLAPRDVPARSTELERVARAVDARDGYTARHSRRVRELAIEIGRVLGFNDTSLALVAEAALFHDVGKLAVPDSILLKPRGLTKAEWEVMRAHSEEGARLLERLGVDAAAVAAVRHHHEHFDGSGYPVGLAGEEIPLFSRIIHVTDAFDSMTSDRAYRRARPMLEAIHELRAGVGEQFCPRCVRALEAHYENVALRGATELGAAAR